MSTFGAGAHKETHDVLYATVRPCLWSLLTRLLDKEKGGIQHHTAIFTMVLRLRQAAVMRDL
jgi:hypothetical protein